jgi:hypothetical protein
MIKNWIIRFVSITVKNSSNKKLNLTMNKCNGLSYVYVSRQRKIIVLIKNWMIGFQCIDIKMKQYNKNLIYEWISIVGYNSKKAL